MEGLTAAKLSCSHALESTSADGLKVKGLDMDLLESWSLIGNGVGEAEAE